MFPTEIDAKIQTTKQTRKNFDRHWSENKDIEKNTMFSDIDQDPPKIQKQ